LRVVEDLGVHVEEVQEPTTTVPFMKGWNEQM